MSSDRPAKKAKAAPAGAPPPSSAWSVVLVPNADDARQHFVELRKNGEPNLRMPEPVWVDSPTMHPGSAGTIEHETWLQESVKYRPSDFVITTYPKCGTTLTEQVTLLLLNGGRAEDLDPLSKNSANLHHQAGKVWPEACIMPSSASASSNDWRKEANLAYPPGRPPKEEMIGLPLERFEALPAPRVIKTHSSVAKVLGRKADGTPGAARYLVCTRNPLDACVSCFYHGWNPQKSGWPFEAFARAWLEGHGNGGFGCWFDFHVGWKAVYDAAQRRASSAGGEGNADAATDDDAMNATTAPHVLWLSFEEMVHFPAREVGRVAAFLGLPHDAELIQRVVAGSAFDSMKSAASTAEQGSGRVNTSAHLRKGGVGDWRNHFSAELAAEFRLAFERRMRGTGLRFDLGEGEFLEATSSVGGG